MERLLLVCMITDTSLSDDYGRLPADAAILKKHAFGYDDYSTEQVRDWRDAILAACRNVHPYTVNEREYIELRNFDAYQSARYKRRSNIPAPPREIAEDSQNISPISQTILEDSRTSRDEMSRDEMRSGEESRVELRQVEKPSPAAAPLPPELRPEPNADPVVAHLFALLDKAAVIVNGTMQAEAWTDLLDITRDKALLSETFVEAARTGKHPSPNWCRVVLERCIRDNTRPGKWNGDGRARDEPAGKPYARDGPLRTITVEDSQGNTYEETIG